METLADTLRSVELQREHGDAAAWREAGDARPVEAEVLGPTIESWMKQRDDLMRKRIYRGKIGPFDVVTVPAGERKIFGDTLPSVLRGNDVIRFVRKDSIIFVKEARLAT